MTVFGYLILISINYYDFISPFTGHGLSFNLDWEVISNIPDSIRVWPYFKKTSRFVNNTSLRVVFSTLSSVFASVVKNCLSCLIYYSHYRGSSIPWLPDISLQNSQLFPDKNKTAGDFATGVKSPLPLRAQRFGSNPWFSLFGRSIKMSNEYIGNAKGN